MSHLTYTYHWNGAHLIRTTTGHGITAHAIVSPLTQEWHDVDASEREACGENRDVNAPLINHDAWTATTTTTTED